MNPGASEPQEVPVDVLPPVPKDAPVRAQPVTKQTPPFSDWRSFYHPASGVVILAFDWLAFGSDLLSGFLALPLICILSFLLTLPFLYLIQIKWSQDTPASALGKAFLGAFLVGLPFPITGTLLGASVLALSGLPHNPVEAFKKLTSQQDTSAK